MTNSDEKDTKTDSEDEVRQNGADGRRLLGEGSNADESGQESTKRYASIGLGLPLSMTRPDDEGISEQDESKPKREFLTY